jgi:hypothetical protein
LGAAPCTASWLGAAAVGEDSTAAGSSMASADVGDAGACPLSFEVSAAAEVEPCALPPLGPRLETPLALFCVACACGLAGLRVEPPGGGGRASLGIPVAPNSIFATLHAWMQHAMHCCSSKSTRLYADGTLPGYHACTLNMIVRGLYAGLPLSPRTNAASSCLLQC